jgi:hypothetical protein
MRVPWDHPTVALPDEISPAAVRARQERAVAAAVATGRELGITVTEPQVLYDVFSVIGRCWSRSPNRTASPRPSPASPCTRFTVTPRPTT